jgi:glycosyltransferase involved in cell wall biosynthesis
MPVSFSTRAQGRHMQEATAATIAVIVPCHHEEATVAKVVADFRRALPQAAVWVFDNASTDATVERARAAGACVAQVPLKGKGCRFALREEDRIDLAPLDRATEARALQALAPYRLRFAPAGCRRLDSWIGFSSVPYLWCEVEPAR